MVHIEQKSKTRWTVVTSSGTEYLINKEDNKYEQLKYYRSIQGRDTQTGEVMITREDNLKMVFRPDGSTLVEYEDGTRITAFYVSLDATNDKETGEFRQRSDKKEKYVKIECPGFATTIFNSNSTECTLAFGNGTLVACDPKKMTYNLVNSTGEILDIGLDGLVSFYPKYELIYFSHFIKPIYNMIFI